MNFEPTESKEVTYPVIVTGSDAFDIGKSFLFFIRGEYNNFDYLLDSVKTAKDALESFEYMYFSDYAPCPYCGQKERYVFKDYDHYKCAKCRRQFKIKTGTIFHDSILTYRQIIIGCYLIMGKNISCRQLAVEMGVTVITAQKFYEKIQKIWNV